MAVAGWVLVVVIYLILDFHKKNMFNCQLFQCTCTRYAHVLYVHLNELVSPVTLGMAHLNVNPPVVANNQTFVFRLLDLKKGVHF